MVEDMSKVLIDYVLMEEMICASEETPSGLLLRIAG
jgi:hypothetical protein